MAGDFTGGPQPQETIDRLRALDPWVVRGNAEQYVLDLESGAAPESWYTSDQWATLRWSFDRLRRDTVDWIASLPEQRVISLDGGAVDPIRVVHGTPASIYDFMFPDRDREVLDQYDRAELLPQQVPPLVEFLDGVPEAVLVCAHSHIPWQQQDGGTLTVNAGAVGGSNNGDPRAHYALLDWVEEDAAVYHSPPPGGRWMVTLRPVAYDMDRVRAAYRDTGYLAAGGLMAEAFLRGVVSGTNLPGKFVRYARRMAGFSGYRGGERLPDDLWQRAFETFDWGE